MTYLGGLPKICPLGKSRKVFYRKLPSLLKNSIFPARMAKMSQSAVKTQKGNKNTCNLAATRLQPLTVGWALREFRPRKPKIWPQILEMYMPRLLYLPVYRKWLNSVAWDDESIFNSNLLIWLPAFVAKFLYVLATGSSPPQLLRAVFSVTWDAASWVWSPPYVCWKETHNSQTFRLLLLF